MNIPVGDSRDDGPAILPSLWQFRGMVAIVVVCAGLLGFGVSQLQTTLYEAEASLLLLDSRDVSVFRDPQPQFGDPNRHVRSQAERITSLTAAARIAERLGIDDLDEVRDNLVAEPSDEFNQVVIRARATTPQAAVALAETAADVYGELVAEEVAADAEAATAGLQEASAELEARIERLEAELQTNPDDATLVAERDAAVSQLVTVRSRAEQLAVDAGLYGDGIEFYEPPEVPESPVQPKVVRNTLAAVALGLLAATALAWWRAERVQEAEGRRDPAAILGGALLGEVPDFRDVGASGPVPTASAPRSAAAEAYHFIAAALEFALDEVVGDRGGTRTVLVTSAGPADGKTTTVLNLAVAISREGRRVRLVDGDGRMRGLSRLAGMERRAGLLDLGDADVVGETAVAVEFDDAAGLSLVPAGTETSDPASFFRAPAFRRAMAAVKEDTDVVLVDSPPLLSVSDTAAMSSQADGIVMVVDRGTPLALLDEVRQRLEFTSAPLLGYVFNRADAKLSPYAGYGDPVLLDGHDPRAAGNGSGKVGRHARGRRRRWGVGRPVLPRS